MDRESVFNDITGVFEDVVDVEPGKITEASSGETIEEWDSLAHVRLMVAIERKFGLRFSNAEIESMKNVGDLVTLVLAKKAG